MKTFVPLTVYQKKYGDIRKVKETPLFEGFVFVKIMDIQHKELKKINGVVNMVYWLGKPVSVIDREIKAKRLFLRDCKNITIEKTEIKNNDRINTHDSYTIEHEGPLVTIKNKKAYVVLPSLGYMFTAEVETPNGTIISSEGVLN